MIKYIIKNCPAIYGDEYCKENTYEDGTVLCQDCTNCLLKQIVELCKEEFKGQYSDAWSLAQKISELLDIQEVE
jgi:hypothetical protein